MCFFRKINFLAGNRKINLNTGAKLTQVYIYMSHVYVYTPVLTVFMRFPDKRLIFRKKTQEYFFVDFIEINNFCLKHFLVNPLLNILQLFKQ